MLTVDVEAQCVEQKMPRERALRERRPSGRDAAADRVGHLIRSLRRIGKARHRIGIEGKHRQIVDDLLLVNVADGACLVDRVSAQRNVRASRTGDQTQHEQGSFIDESGCTDDAPGRTELLLAEG